MVQDRDGQRGLSQAFVQGGSNYSVSGTSGRLPKTNIPPQGCREGRCREGRVGTMTLKGPKEAGASKGSQAEGFFSGETPYGPGQRWTERSLPGLCAGGNNYSRGLAHLADCLKQTFPPQGCREGRCREGRVGTMTLKGPKEAGASKGSQAEGFFSGETPYGPGQRWTERSLPGLCAGGSNYSRGLAHLADCPKQTFPPKDAGREDVEREGWGQ